MSGGWRLPQGASGGRVLSSEGGCGVERTPAPGRLVVTSARQAASSKSSAGLFRFRPDSRSCSGRRSCSALPLPSGRACSGWRVLFLRWPCPAAARRGASSSAGGRPHRREWLAKVLAGQGGAKGGAGRSQWCGRFPPRRRAGWPRQAAVARCGPRPSCRFDPVGRAQRDRLLGLT